MKLATPGKEQRVSGAYAPQQLLEKIWKHYYPTLRFAASYLFVKKKKKVNSKLLKNMHCTM